MLDLTGKRFKSYKPHQASVVDICVDATGDFIATASIDGELQGTSTNEMLMMIPYIGQVVIISLSTTESYAVDMKRPMRTISLEPNFAKKSTRSFVSGGLAGSLVLHEKGWLGHKQTVLHVGEGPIWQARWRGRLIAWANDLVSCFILLFKCCQHLDRVSKIYDTTSQSRITFIDRPAGQSTRRSVQMYPSLARRLYPADILGRPYQGGKNPCKARTTTTAASATYLLFSSNNRCFQLDCMIAGILPIPRLPHPSLIPTIRRASIPENIQEQHHPYLHIHLPLPLYYFGVQSARHVFPRGNDSGSRQTSSESRRPS